MTPIADPDALTDWAVVASSAQQRLWFLHHAATDRTLLTLSGGVRLTGALDPADVIAAVRSAVARHEVLRSAFALYDDVLHQVITTTIPEIEYVDAAADPDRVAALAAAESGRPFELTRAPLIRFTLIRTGIGEHVLLVNAHHIIVDAWSLELLSAEVADGLRTSRDGRAVSGQAPELQYADYAAWQAEQLETTRFGDQLSWWQGELAGAPRLELPPSRVPPGPVPTVAGVRLTLDRGRTAALRALAEAADGSLFTTVLASFHAMFARLTGRTDVVLGSTVAGRTSPETETMLGLFANMVAVRLRVDLDAGFLELATQAAHVCGEVYERQDVPFDLVVERAAGNRARTGHPLFPVLVQAIPPSSPMRVPGLEIELLPGQRRPSDLDLLVTVIDEIGELRLEVDHRADRHTDEAVGELLGAWQELLDAVLKDPDRPLGTMAITRSPAVPGPQAPASPPAAARPGDQPGADRTTASALADVWSDVLGTPPDGADTNFFEAGGSSLQIMILLSKVQARFGVEIPLDRFLNDPTPDRLGAELTAGTAPAPDRDALEEILGNLERAGGGSAGSPSVSGSDHV